MHYCTALSHARVLPLTFHSRSRGQDAAMQRLPSEAGPKTATELPPKRGKGGTSKGRAQSGWSSEATTTAFRQSCIGLHRDVATQVKDASPSCHASLPAASKWSKCHIGRRRPATMTPIAPPPSTSWRGSQANIGVGKNLEVNFTGHTERIHVGSPKIAGQFAGVRLDTGRCRTNFDNRPATPG